MKNFNNPVIQLDDRISGLSFCLKHDLSARQIAYVKHRYTKGITILKTEREWITTLERDKCIEKNSITIH